MEVNTTERLAALKIRKKLPLIYHAFNVTNAFGTITLQIKPIYPKVEGDDVSAIFWPKPRLVLLLRKDKMPTINNCDYVHLVSSINEKDEGKKHFVKIKAPLNKEDFQMIFMISSFPIQFVLTQWVHGFWHF